MAGVKRWVVRATEAGRSVETFLAEAGDPVALDEGRVFVNGARAVEPQEVALDDVVSLWASRSMGDASITVLAHRDGFLVVDKPAALPTTPDHRGHRSLMGEVSQWLHREGIAGDPHPISRLDVGVSGAVTFALTPAARKRIESTARGEAGKRYLGIVSGKLEGEGLIEGRIGKRTVRGAKRPSIRDEGRDAVTRFRVLASTPSGALVELVPVTGRTHQLRLHLESRGAPLFGDRAHGGPTRVVTRRGVVRSLDRIMLHAHSIALPMADGTVLEVESPVPEALIEIWRSLDGPGDAWNAPAPDP